MARAKTSQEVFLELFADDLSDSLKAQEIYAALCNNRWRGREQVFDFSWRAAGEFVANLRNDLGIEVDDPELCQRCQKKKGEHIREERETYMSLLLKEKTGEDFRLPVLLCQEGGDETFFPGYLGPEDYMDYYCSGNEGKVAPWIREKFTEYGWAREDYDMRKDLSRKQ